MKTSDESFAIEVKNSPFDPDLNEKVVLVRRSKVLGESSSAQTLYRVFLFLDGPDLPFVRSATYHLHSSFPDPIRRVSRTVGNPRCKLTIWTWGLFQLSVAIEDKSGRQHSLFVELDYDRVFDRKDVRFVEA